MSIEKLSQEPVRVAAYTALAAIFVILIAFGVIEESAAAAILAPIAVLLGVPMTEVTRSKVSPVLQADELNYADALGTVGDPDGVTRNPDLDAELDDEE